MAKLTAKQIAASFGFTPRHWIRQAALGKVPGAYQPSGERGTWLFDSEIFTRWYKGTGRKVNSWPGFTGAEASIGRVRSERAASSESPLRHQIDGLLSAALRSGKTGLKPLPGANVHEFPLAKRRGNSSASTSRT